MIRALNQRHFVARRSKTARRRLGAREDPWAELGDSDSSSHIDARCAGEFLTGKFAALEGTTMTRSFVLALVAVIAGRSNVCMAQSNPHVGALRQHRRVLAHERIGAAVERAGAHQLGARLSATRAGGRRATMRMRRAAGRRAERAKAGPATRDRAPDTHRSNPRTRRPAPFR